MFKSIAALALLLIAVSSADDYNIDARLDRMETMLSDIKKCSCGGKDDSADGPRVVNCSPNKLETWSDGSYILNATHGSWETSNWCRMIDPTVVTSPSYNISVDLFNYNSNLGIHYGHPGLAYNYQDDDNFDFVYIRVHNSASCYQTGQMVDGAFNTGSTGGCSPDPQGRQWFNLLVTVTPSGASVYLDGHLLVTRSNHHPVVGHGGVIVSNGYQNVVHFRNFNLMTA